MLQNFLGHGGISCCVSVPLFFRRCLPSAVSPRRGHTSRADRRASGRGGDLHPAAPTTAGSQVGY